MQITSFNNFPSSCQNIGTLSTALHQIDGQTLFQGFSQADQRLRLLIEKGICDELGNPTEKIAKIFIEAIPKFHPIYTSFLKVLNIQNNEIVELIEILKTKSNQPITDVQIIGSQLWRVLAQYPDLLKGWIEIIFGQVIDKEDLEVWTKEFLESRNPANNLHAGQETDTRIVCPSGTFDNLCALSQYAREWLEQYFYHLGSINKFAIINETTTLVGFQLHTNPDESRELIFTSQSATLSSDTSLFASIYSDGLQIDSLGFSIAKIFIDSFCKIYTPYTLDNPQAWIRLTYHSDCIPMNDFESQMVNNLFKPFASDPLSEDFVWHMENLGYSARDAQNYLKLGTFSSVQERLKTLYLYFLIKRRIKTKLRDDDQPPSQDSNALFVFRCCQSMNMYGQLSDQSIAHLIRWLNEDSLLIYPGTHEFLKLFAEGNVPYSVVSAVTILAGWIEQPESFTDRQNPNLFFIDRPFTLRIPTDIPAALELLENYLSSAGNPEILKCLYACLITEPLSKMPYHKKLCEKLHLTQDSIGSKADFLLNASDPFIRFLGMQIKLIFNNRENDFFIFDKLPDLLQLNFKPHLDALYSRAVQDLNISESSQNDCYSLSGWIRLFIESNQREYILFAYRLWKKNIKSENKELDFHMLNALSQVEPRLAIKLLLEQPDSKFETGSSLKIVSNISNAFPVAFALNQELYPLIEKLILDPATDFKAFKESFLTFMLNFLSHLEDFETGRFLLLATVLKGNINPSLLAEDLQLKLKPLLPFLMRRYTQGPAYSPIEIESILYFSKSEKDLQVSEQGLLAGLEVIAWIFHPHLKALVSIDQSNLKLFFYRLCEFIKESSSKQKILPSLLKKIADIYAVDYQKLNPIILNDWIRLLAQTREHYLIDLACDIWKENRTECEPDMDLKLFQALMMVHPYLAYHHFCDLYTFREPPLTLLQFAVCLKMMMDAYRVGRIKQELIRLYPVINSFLKEPNSLKKTVLKSFAKSLTTFIESIGKTGIRNEFLLKSILKGYLKPINLRSDFYDFICDQNEMHGLSKYSRENYQKMRLHIARDLSDKNDLRAYHLLDSLINENIVSILAEEFYQFLATSLQKLISAESISDPMFFFRLTALIRMDPLIKSVSTASILKNVFEKVFSFNSDKVSQINFIEFDELLIKHPKVLLNIERWHQQLFMYLSFASSEQRLPNALQLFVFLSINNPKTDKISEIDLFRLLAGIIHSHNYPALPSSVRTIISRLEKCIEIFMDEGDWKTSSIYLCASKHYGLPVKDILAKTWKVCYELSGLAGSLPLIIELLEKQIPQNHHLITFQEHQILFLQSIILRFIKDISIEAPDIHIKWLIFFLNRYLLRPPEIPLKLDCPDEFYKEILPKVLSTNPSLQLKKFFLLGNGTTCKSLKEAAFKEIASQYSSTKINFPFCLNLIQKYFFNDFSIRHYILERLETCKDEKFIQVIINDLDHFNSQINADLIECWIYVFNYLKKHRHIKIWDYLNRLPIIFHKNIFQESRKKAEKILIEACISVLNNPIEISSNRMFNIEEAELALTEKICFFEDASLEIYHKFMGVLTSEFIFSQTPKIIVLSYRLLKKFEDTNYRIERPSEKFKANFNIFLSAGKINFLELQNITLSNTNINLLDALEFCLISSLRNFKLDGAITSIELAYLIMRYRLSKINLASLTIECGPYLHFYNLYKNLSLILNTKFDSQDNLNTQDITSISIHLLSRIYCEFTLNPKDYSVLLDEAISSIFPDNLNYFDPEYLTLIFAFIYSLNQTHKHTFALKKLCVSQVLKIMQEKLKNNKKKEFFSIKNLFENAMNWLMKLNYQSNIVTPDNFEKIHELLSLAKNEQFYGDNDTWLSVHIHLFSVQSQFADPKKKEIPLQVFLKLIEFNTPISIDRASTLFLNSINHFKIYEDKVRIALFKNLMTAVLNHPLTILDGNTFISYIYYHRNKNIKLNEQENLFIKGGIFFNYIKKISEIEFNTNLLCIENLKNNKDKPYMIAHYVQLGLYMAILMGERQFFSENLMEYLKILETLLNNIIYVESLHLKAKITHPSLQTPEPNALAVNFTDALMAIKESEASILIQKQNTLLKDFFSKLITLVKDYPLSQEETCSNIFDLFFAIIAQTSESYKKNYLDLFSFSLKELEKFDLTPHHQIFIKMLRFHCLIETYSEDPEKLVEDFSLCNELLLQVPLNTTYWCIFYKFIDNAIGVIFKFDPERKIYRDACLNFLNRHLEYFDPLKHEVLNSMGIIIPNLMHKLIEYKLLDIAEEACINQFSVIKNWFNEKEIKSPALDLLELTIFAPNLDRNHLSMQIGKLIPDFLKWMDKYSQNNHLRHLTALLRYVPNHEFEILIKDRINDNIYLNKFYP